MRAVLILVILLLMAVGIWWSGAVERTLGAIPSHWKPWAPLAVREVPGPVIRIKLARLASDREECLSALAVGPGA